MLVFRHVSVLIRRIDLVIVEFAMNWKNHEADFRADVNLEDVIPGRS